MLDALGVSSAPDAQRAFKADLVDTVGREASAVLLDPDVSLPALVDRDLVARDVGLIVRIEADGHEERDGLRRSALIDGLGAAGARALGATAAKVMVFLRADREDLDGHTAAVVRAALEDCRRADLLCVMELMTYRTTTRRPSSSPRARRTSSSRAPCCCRSAGRKLLKLEYPGSGGGLPARHRRARRAVGGAVGRASTTTRSAPSSATRWTAGPTASSPGARCGRRPSARRPTERRRFLDGIARRRMEEMLAIVEAAA